MREGIESSAEVVKQEDRDGRSWGLIGRSLVAKLALLFAAAPGIPLHADEPPADDPRSAAQRLLTIEEFADARAVVEKLTRDLIPKMNDDKYMVRQHATDEATALVARLAHTVNPLPRDIETILAPKRGELSLEQLHRVRWIRSVLDQHAEIGAGPTRVPIRDGASAIDVLSLLSAHGGMTIRFVGEDTGKRLTSLRLPPAENSFGEIVQAVAGHTGTIPRVANGKHFVLELAPKDREDQRVLLDTSGMVLGVYTPRTSLDLIADPQCAFIALSSAKVSGSDPLKVRLQPTMTPLWHSLKDMGQPTLTMHAGSDEASQFGRSELTLVVGMQSHPKTVDVPLASDRLIAFGGLQSMRVEEKGDAGTIEVRMFHPEDAYPSHFWTEMRGCTPQLCLLDEHGQPLPTQALSLSYALGVGGGSAFSTELKSEGNPAALRIRAYTEQDPYYPSYGGVFGDEDRRTEVRFHLPPRKE